MFHSLYDGRQNLVRHNFVRITRQAVFERLPPRHSQFGIDVDDVNSGGDCLAKVVVTGTRTAVQGEKDSRCFLDSGDPFNIQVLLGFALHHAFNHAVRVANRRSEDINAGRVDELSRFLRCCELSVLDLRGLVNFRTSSYVSYLPLHEYCRIDRFERLNRFLGASHILLEGQRREINSHGVKTRISRIDSLPQ